MKEAQGAKIGNQKAKSLLNFSFQKLEKRKNADQAILSLKSHQNCKILKGNINRS